MKKTLGDLPLLTAAQIDPQQDRMLIWDASAPSPKTKSVLVSQLATGQASDYIKASTKPSQRPDATALQIGDRWLNLGNLIEYVWSGSQWLSAVIFTVSSGHGNRLAFITGHDLQILEFVVVARTGATYNATNYCVFHLGIQEPTSVRNETPLTVTSSPNTSFRASLNWTANPVSRTNAVAFVTRQSKVGTPTDLTGIECSVNYRLIAP